MKARLRYGLAVGILAAVYFLAARIGLSLAFETDQVTTVWPPTGLALAALLVFGYRFWPGIAIGAFLANLLTNEPAPVAAVIATGNTLEALAGTYLARLFKLNPAFGRVRDVASLVFVALVATTISASIGTLALTQSGLVRWQQYDTVWFTWWIGDLMGAMIFAPLLLIGYAAYRRRRVWGVSSKVEAAVLAIGIICISWVVFALSDGSWGRAAVQLVVPFVIWAALRFRQAGVVIAGFVITMTAVWGTISGNGPFAALPTERGLIQLHIFMFVTMAVGLVLAAVVSQRDSTEWLLREQADQLEASLEEKRQLEAQLREANQRATGILGRILEESSGLEDDETKQP